MDHFVCPLSQREQRAQKVENDADFRSAKKGMQPFGHTTRRARGAPAGQTAKSARPRLACACTYGVQQPYCRCLGADGGRALRRVVQQHTPPEEEEQVHEAEEYLCSPLFEHTPFLMSMCNLACQNWVAESLQNIFRPAES
eukprot:363984-Chlamydomonas_euryale.AAC.19